MAYVIALITLGVFRSKNSRKSPEEYILAGRRLSLPGFVVTLVATWYGGILGIGENTYLNGVQTWFIFGLPYYFFAILFSLFLSSKIHAEKRLSIPDHFHHHYGRNAGLISAVFILILASPAPYILSLGILVQYFSGIPFEWALISAASISMIYIWYGGFGAVVRTDYLQMALMFFGFGFLLLFAWHELGSPIQMFSTIPTKHLNPQGGMGITYILVWFFIALWTFIDPGFHQRTSAAKNSKTARNGILIAVAFWFIFDMLTLFTGLYARSLIITSEPMFVYPMLASKILPPFLFGIFLTGLLATIMSTIDSLGLISAVTFGRDILWRINPPQDTSEKAKDNSALEFTRSSLIVIGFIAIILALSIPSVVQLWYVIGSITVPGILLPFLLTFTKIKLNKNHIIMSMLVPVLFSIFWFIVGNLLGDYPFGIEPFYPGLAASLILIFFQYHFHK
ncbi:MAG: sodium:solute symporter family protein [Candidatus Marinimicrobia bacterium]|nr:sodium:solute symporter family protein [Candidatus Neomarinimicrobiota bacterium]MBT5339552.1 sodium:solute symporter family protein [Candidatus Neomarinimicrobiota bacterium]MBT6369033.1 sodium:solute symporter family protein [Candidatus Neomarinimicrobiota bacterium]MBT7871990.1 sodium:solute symporter family protein [Candidatus Neomarinimicrobiota bacterium]